MGPYRVAGVGPGSLDAGGVSRPLGVRPISLRAQARPYGSPGGDLRRVASEQRAPGSTWYGTGLAGRALARRLQVRGIAAQSQRSRA